MRLVAGGFKQRGGFRLLPRHIPRLVFIYLLGAVAWELTLNLCRFDAELAFFQSSPEDDFCMRLPPGCVELCLVNSQVEPPSRRLQGSVDVVAQPSHHPRKESWIDQSLADACVLRLIESVSASPT